jgi:hypothetical protein
MSIKDVFGRSKIDNAAMTKLADGVYEYVWQSDVTDEEGDYYALIKIVTVSGTSYEKIEFTIEEQP